MERTLRMSGQGLGLGRVGRNRVLMVKVLGIDGMAIVTRSSRIGGGRGRRGGGVWMGRDQLRILSTDGGCISETFTLHFIKFYSLSAVPVCYMTIV